MVDGGCGVVYDYVKANMVVWFEIGFILFFFYCFFFFNDTATTEIYTLSLHDALPICRTVMSKERLRLNGNCAIALISK